MGILRCKRRVRWGSILGMDRKGLSTWRRSGLSVVAVVGLCMLLTLREGSPNAGDYGREAVASSRRLLTSENTSAATKSSSHTPIWEQCDFELSNYPNAWVVHHTVGILIIFIAIAVVCDDFFVPSLEAISDKLKLSEDVAGATFMAAGSSAPELFTSVAGVAVETDVGVGTIVGSAVFNILIIIALTAALAGKVLNLDWRPLIRDSFFYAMSIACFIGFSWDGFFVHYEASVLLGLYIIYIVLMAFNPQLMDWMAGWRCCCVTTVLPADEENAPTTPDSGDQLPLDTNVTTLGTQGRLREPVNGTKTGTQQLGAKTSTDRISEEQVNTEQTTSFTEEYEEDDLEETIQICPCIPICPPIRTSIPDATETLELGGVWNWFKLILRWVIFVPAFPFFILFSWSIPDCSKDHNKKWFLLSFFMSVLWIAALSFGMVTLVSRIGCILNIDSYTMGLVVIAMGTSIPDAMSSVLVARDGYGDMAVSNAIGSNVFDINLGIGLPFIIRIAVDRGKPISLLSTEEWIDFHTGAMPIVPHAKFGFILLVILIFALIVFVMVRFRLNKAIGVAFVFMYCIFLVYAFLQELYCVRVLKTYC